MEDTLRAEFVEKIPRSELCLNPYSNGRYSTSSINLLYENTVDPVLILILMEDTLREQASSCCLIRIRPVLILILMEDTLRGSVWCFNGTFPWVLILILMEDTLRDPKTQILHSQQVAIHLKQKSSQLFSKNRSFLRGCKGTNKIQYVKERQC